jgi:hypothetical protein
MKINLNLNEDQLDRLPYYESKTENLTRRFTNVYEVFDYRRGYNRNDAWIWAYRILEKNIGKSFDKAFSYFCKKVEFQYQSVFLKEFYEYTLRYKHYADYKIDKNGNIQRVKSKKRSKVVSIKSPDYAIAYIHIHTNEELILNTNRDGSDDKNPKRHDQNRRCQPEEFVPTIVSGSIQYFESKNDPRFKKYHADKNKKLKRDNKLYRKQQQEKAYSFLTSSEKENKLNKIENNQKIVSHGFDLKTSFRK